MYIEKLEQVPNSYQFLLRPRKFGKSLFISMMQYYYGVEHKDNFQQLFGEYYIGENATPLANSYYVLMFDFSGIATYDSENLIHSFKNSVLKSIVGFNTAYRLLTEEEIKEFNEITAPADILGAFLIKVSGKGKKNVFILIDEYDHFTNELLSFDINLFKTSVSRNGFLRKFFEVIKIFTGTGLVERLFATGVTPVTLDSLTSGFNIAKNLTLDERFNEIMGFEEREVYELLCYYEVAEPEKVLLDMRSYYNGSKFSTLGAEKLYNSNMVLYFLDELVAKSRYPKELIDVNIASDYSKIANIFALNSGEETEQKIDDILSKGETEATLTAQFSFEREFTANDLISLLYYNGLLTIKDEQLGSINFCIPNYVITELYWKFMAERIVKQAEITVNTSELRSAMQQMANEGKIDLYMSIINNVMKDLSNRDLMHFDEKYIKILFMAFASLSPIYNKKSEYEANKKYPDLLFLSTPVIPVENQMLFEFKYVKVSESHRLEEKMAEATAQIQGYLELEEIKNLKGLHSYAIVFVGESGTWRQVPAVS